MAQTRASRRGPRSARPRRPHAAVRAAAPPASDLTGTGGLHAGDRLPPLRQLANDLGLAVGTVARTYRELENEGLLVSRRGGGTRVSNHVRELPPDSRTTRLAELAEPCLTRARALGCSEAEIRQALG